VDEVTVGIAQESMNVVSKTRQMRPVPNNLALAIDARDVGAAQAGGIEFGDHSGGRAQEAVHQVAGVDVVARDDATLVDGPGDSTLTGAGSRTRSVKEREGRSLRGEPRYAKQHCDCHWKKSRRC